MNESLDLSIEPAANWHLTPVQKERLTDVLDGYLSRLENGLPPSRDDLLEAHPDLAAPLRAYFQSLDELHDMAAGFQRPTTERSVEPNSSTGDERRLGDFRLLREVGRGGMGVVYEAEQISLGRRVALKVLPFAAVLDSRQIARFKHEAQAAGQLNHPNIVSVFAVGVERGVHYYAMQFIDGQPLDRVIEEMRQRAHLAPGDAALPTRIALHAAPPLPMGEGREEGGLHQSVQHPSHVAPQDATESFHLASQYVGHLADGKEYVSAPSTQRAVLTSRPAGSSEYIRGIVALGVDVARALHAAHESGIVHRDIKPSNLLLDGAGKIWVTDFGLARRETDIALTHTGDLVGTMRYMSPEQAAGQMALVDHRTDIYSLGATLYELLTLEPAIPGHESQALLRHIERHDPIPLRQLQPKVPLDLQTVVMKGMAKRREDRYATSNDFADDLQRVLEGKPIVARPPTLLDRAARWGQRHRELVVVAGAVCLLALVGFAVSTFLISRAHDRKYAENYTLAEERFQEAHDAVEKLGRQVLEQLEHVPGTAEVRKELLQKTLGYYRGFLDQAKDKPELQADLASTYSKIGMLSADSGSIDDAIQADKEAIRIYQELAHVNPDNADWRRRLGVCEDYLGSALARSGKTDEARQAFNEAIRLQEEVLDKGENKVQCQTDLGTARNNLGSLCRDTGDVAGAATAFAQAATVQEQLLASAPNDPDRLRNLAATLNNLGALYVDSKPDEAIKSYERARALQTKAVAIQHDSPYYRSELAVTYNNLGRAYARKGDSAAAAESFAKAIDLQTAAVQGAPTENSYRRYLAVGYTNLGLEQSRQGNATAAEASMRRALELQETLVKQNPHDVQMLSTLGGMFNNLGIVLEELKHPADALAAYEQAVGRQKKAVAEAPEIVKYRQFLNTHYYNYGRLLRQTGRADDALQVALSRRELWPNDPNRLFAVAEELSAAANERAVKDKGSSVATEYARRAVETLKQAIAAGWKPKPNSNWTKSFAAVRNRPDFPSLTF